MSDKGLPSGTSSNNEKLLQPAGACLMASSQPKVLPQNHQSGPYVSLWMYKAEAGLSCGSCREGQYIQVNDVGDRNS